MQGVSDSDFSAFIFPLLVCQNFPGTEMISQASCVFFCAVGAVLLGVVDGDNAALWLELTTTESATVACSTSGRGEEKGGRRGPTLPAAC